MNRIARIVTTVCLTLIGCAGALADLHEFDTKAAGSKMLSHLQRTQNRTFAPVGSIQMLWPLGQSVNVYYLGYFLSQDADSLVASATIDLNLKQVKVGWIYEKDRAPDLDWIEEYTDTVLVKTKITEIAGVAPGYLQLIYSAGLGACIPWGELGAPTWRVILKDGTEHFLWHNWRLGDAVAERKAFFEEQSRIIEWK